MDLRNCSDHLSPINRCDERRKRIEQDLGVDLSALSVDPIKLGQAEERNCEQMFGQVPIPVGYAGPLPVTFSSGETAAIHLPLATTEGALVASVNRGCKALGLCGGVKTTSIYHGVSRSIALKSKDIPRVILSPVEGSTRDGNASRASWFDRVGPSWDRLTMTRCYIQELESEWKSVGEATSSHLKILRYEVDFQQPYLFLTIYADTDEAMGMNMVTLAADAIGKWLAENLDLPAGRSSSSEGWEFVTVAANVDSDKKPSTRTHDRGRGYEVTATATIPPGVIQSVLKTTPEALLEVAHAKLDLGSDIAGALGRNCHAANIIAALYIATGQDPAHVVEGSLADTVVQATDPLSHRERVRVRGVNTITISTRLPALLVGVHGGGTTLPAQQQCLNLLLKAQSLLPAYRTGRLTTPRQLAETIGAAVLAGELSLLAAQSAHHLGTSHKMLARNKK